MINGQFEPFVDLKDLLCAKYLALGIKHRIGGQRGSGQNVEHGYNKMCVLVLVKTERGEEGSFKR